MEKKDKKQQKEEEEEEEEVEEVEEEEEVEDKIGEDFSKDPRAFSFLQDAGMLADKALQQLISKCKPGSNLHDLCSESDLFIKEELSKIYTKKKFIKGLAFPTCISLNEVCGNYSAPLEITDDPHEYSSWLVPPFDAGTIVKFSGRPVNHLGGICRRFAESVCLRRQNML